MHQSDEEMNCSDIFSVAGAVTKLGGSLDVTTRVLNAI
jgi:hypothetical protein